MMKENGQTSIGKGREWTNKESEEGSNEKEGTNREIKNFYFFLNLP